jgi:hypothetical protein
VADVNIRVTTSGADEAAATFRGMGQSLKNALEVATGVSLARLFEEGVRGAVDFTKHLVAIGLEAQRQERIFEQFTQAIGVNATAMTAAMEKAGRGLADIGETMVAQQQLFKAGFQPEQIVGLMEAAFARAAASGKDVTEVFNAMGTAIAQAKARGVEAVGVLIDQEAAMDAYAASIGKAAKDLTEAEKSQAIYAATLKATRGEIEQFGEAQLNLAQMFTLVKVQLGEFIEGIGVGLVNGLQAAVSWILQFKDQFIAAGQALANFGSVIGTNLLGALTGVWEGLKAIAEILGPVLIPLLISAAQALGGALVVGLLAVQAALLTIVPPLVFVGSIFKDLGNNQIPDLAKASAAADASFAKLEAGLKASAVSAGQMAGILPTVATETGKAADSTGKLGKSLVDVKDNAGPSAAELKKFADEAKKIEDAVGKAAEKLKTLQIGATLGKDAAELEKVRQEFDGIAKALDGIKGEKAAEAARQIRAMGDEAVRLTKLKQEMEAVAKEVEAMNKAFADLSKVTTKLDQDLELENLSEMERTIRAMIQPTKDAVDVLVKLGAITKEMADDELKAARAKAEHILAMKAANEEAGKLGKAYEEDARQLAKLIDQWDRGEGVFASFNDVFSQIPILQTAEKISTLEKAITDMIRNGVDPASEAVKTLQTELDRLRGVEAARALDEIALKAALLGDKFDVAGARVSAAQTNFDRAFKAFRDGVGSLDALTAAADALGEEQRWQRIKQGIEGALLTIPDTFTKIVNGVLAGTTQIDEAFKELGLKLLANFNQLAFKDVFEPFLKAAATFATDLARALEGGDWGRVGDVVSSRLAGTPLGALFGIEGPLGGEAGLMKEGAQFEQGIDVFDIGNLLNAQSIIAGIAVLLNGITQIAQGKVATGIGTIVGGIVGAAAGAFVGAPGVGAAIGSAAGGLIGSLFEEDYPALRRARELQRRRTAEGVVEQIAKDISFADDLGELVQTLQRPLAGTLASQGGVLLTMVEQPEKFGLGVKEAQTVERFLREQGFQMEEFAAGRVGSVAELVSKSGEAFKVLIDGLSQFIRIMQEVTTTVTELESLSLDEFTASFHDLFDVLDVSVALDELGFDAAAGKLRDRLRGIIAALGDSATIIGQITEAAFKAVMRDPTQLLRFANVTQWQKTGEDLEETTERIRTSLELVGTTMKAMETETLALLSPLDAATMSIGKATSAIADADWNGMADALNSSDPGEWGAAVVEAHDLLIARYEAEMALIRALIDAFGLLSHAATSFIDTVSSLSDLGVRLPGAQAFAGWFSMAMATAFAETASSAMPTAIPGSPSWGLPGAPLDVVMAAGRGAVDAFAAQSMLAAKTMDLPGLETAFKNAGLLVQGFTATIDQINQIPDPAERMTRFTEALVLVGDATTAAANAAITYWTTLHDTVAGMMDQINTIASSIGAAGDAIAANSGWLVKAGVDIQGLSVQMLGLIDLFPTMTGKLTALASGINLAIAAIQGGQFDVNARPTGGLEIPGLAPAITAALQPVLAGFFNSFVAAMALNDPGQKLAALTTIMNSIGTLLAGLPPDVANALVTFFGPEIRILVGAITTAAAAQAASAAAIATQMQAIIAPSGALSPENFLLLTVAGIQQSLNIIIAGAAPLFRDIATGIVTAGGDIGKAIDAAGIALSSALGGFKTPAEQLTSALTTLSNTIEEKMYRAVSNAINDALGAETGMPYVPKTGIYKLHEGEGVLTAEENALFQRGGLGSFQTGTGSFASMLRGIMTAIGTVAKDFKDAGGVLITALGDAWETAAIAFNTLMLSNESIAGMLQGLIGGASSIAGNVNQILGAAWQALPQLIADAVTVGISAALTAHGLQTGTPYVPHTGLYLLHQGEAVMPASRNGWGRGGGSVSITINIAGHATREDAQYIAHVMQQELKSGTGRVLVERIRDRTL